MPIRNVAVLGGGAGGYVTAVELTLKGYSVAMFGQMRLYPGDFKKRCMHPAWCGWAFAAQNFGDSLWAVVIPSSWLCSCKVTYLVSTLHPPISECL